MSVKYNICALWINAKPYNNLSGHTINVIDDFYDMCIRNNLTNITLYGAFIEDKDIKYIENKGILYKDIIKSCCDNWGNIFKPYNNLYTMVDFGKYVIAYNELHNNVSDYDYLIVTDIDLLDDKSISEKNEYTSANYENPSYVFDPIIISKLEKYGILCQSTGYGLENNLYIYNYKCKCNYNNNNNNNYNNNVIMFIYICITYLSTKYNIYEQSGILNAIDTKIILLSSYIEDDDRLVRGILLKSMYSLKKILGKNIYKTTERLEQITIRTGYDVHIDCVNMLDFYVSCIYNLYSGGDINNEKIGYKCSQFLSYVEKWKPTLENVINEDGDEVERIFNMNGVDINTNDMGISLKFEVTNFNEEILNDYEDLF